MKKYILMLAVAASCALVACTGAENKPATEATETTECTQPCGDAACPEAATECTKAECPKAECPKTGDCAECPNAAECPKAECPQAACATEEVVTEAVAEN